MLDGPVGRIGQVQARVIAADAQLWAKEEVPKPLGHGRRAYDSTDIALLRDVVKRERS